MGGLSGDELIQSSLYGAGEEPATMQSHMSFGRRAANIGGNVDGPVVTGDNNVINVNPTKPFVCLCILDPEDKNNTIDRLEPNQRYEVRIWCENVAGQNSTLIDIQGRSLMQLAVEERFAPYLVVSDPWVELERDDLARFEHIYELKTGVDLPYGLATFSLSYWPIGKEYRKKTAVSQQYEVVGTYNETLFTASHINPDTKRPQDVVIIQVDYAGDNEQIFLTCWGHCGNRHIRSEPFPPPNIKLSEFIEEHTLTVLDNISAFSDATADIGIEARNVPGVTFLGWLKAIYRSLGESMKLAIVDRTETEIPWEMLKLERGTYLGALVPVVRWLSVPLGDGHRLLDFVPHHAVGSVAAYLDNESLSNPAEEMQFLSSFATTFYPDVDTLQLNLGQMEAEIGLVYMGCDGIFTPHGIDSTAYGAGYNPGRFIQLRLETRLSHLEVVHHPIFFVNARHSGRVIRTQGHGKYYHGLPLVLLKYVASSYIGTLGPVSSAYANQLGRHILDAIRGSEDGESIAELLRQLRAQAVTRLIADVDSEDNQLNFIYTFMYIYYGNPLLKISLHPAPQPRGGDDD